MATVIDKAVSWAVGIANDETHGYDQSSRWGPNYDCSSLMIQAWENAGVPVKTKGATYTGNMYKVFIACGFKDVTSSVTLSTGEGLEKGDVLLNTKKHTAMYIGEGTIVHASINENGGITGGTSGDQTGKEICTRSYYNYPWNYVLRYPGGSTVNIPVVSKDDLFISNSYLTEDQMLTNATYICAWLLNRNWTLNAICALLGNMRRESNINPGLWESLDSTNLSGGFGLTQWTPSTKLISWATEGGVDYTDIDVQLTRLQAEMEGNFDQYYPTSDYPETGEEFMQSAESTDYLTAAFMFNYERPNALYYFLEERQQYAREYFAYFSQFTPTIERDKKRMSLLLMYLATRR